MDSCDVLIVGGGPAGSSCAWKLRNSGLNVVILDKQSFPRNKVCGGWITPQVFEELEIDTADYAQDRVMQPIQGFRTSRMRGREVQTDFGREVSYGIRRCEFDDYLLRRCGAQILAGTPLHSLEWSGSWIANGTLRASIVVGAGGHFCPVARHLGAQVGRERIVAAQETEFEMDSHCRERCTIRAEIPELYFCPDLKGYGWCFRKQNFLNIGLGRFDSHALTRHVADFLGFLRSSGKIGFDLPCSPVGHSYLLHGYARRDVAGPGFVLVGDAAGLAYAQSGEGIRPAIESGLLAAEAIMAGDVEGYRDLLAQRFGSPSNAGYSLPSWLTGFLAQPLLANRWFARRFVLERWFLHRDVPALLT